MFHLFRKKRDKKPPQAWLKWLMLAFVFYAVVANHGSKKSEKSEAVQSESSENPIIDPQKIVNIAPLEGKLLPQSVPKLHWEDTLSGKGAPAICGQKATVIYSKTSGDKNLIEPLIKKLIFIIGDGAAPSDIEQAVLGMNKGGKRNITTSRNENFEMELADISPILPDFSGFRIIGDDGKNVDSYKCGEAVKLRVKLWDVAGEKLYDSGEQPLAFTIGKSEVFLGLEQGALGMNIGARRSVIIPPSLQKTLDGSKPLIDLPLPKKQTVVVDIEAVAQ